VRTQHTPMTCHRTQHTPTACHTRVRVLTHNATSNMTYWSPKMRDLHPPPSPPNMSYQHACIYTLHLHNIIYERVCECHCTPAHSILASSTKQASIDCNQLRPTATNCNRLQSSHRTVTRGLWLLIYICIQKRSIVTRLH